MTLTITRQNALDLLGFGSTYTLIEDAVQNLALMPLDQDMLATLGLLPPEDQMRLTARLIDLVEELRDVLTGYDAQLLELTTQVAGTLTSKSDS